MPLGMTSAQVGGAGHYAGWVVFTPSSKLRDMIKFFKVTESPQNM